MKIVLLGYMSSGKTSVGKLLANKLKLNFTDLDQEIEEVTGNTVSKIFSEKGELFFRKKEMEVLRDILRIDQGMVLALGGGTPCYGNNMELVNQNTLHSFYLQLSIGNLVARIAKEKSQRPLVAAISNDELPEFIGKHLFERAPYYAQANYTIDCNGKTEKEVVDAIQLQLV
ncbi:MAG: shikimate kinase [Bacteroidota bacterium]